MSPQNAQETISLMNELISKNLIKTINFAMLDLTFSFNLAQTNHISFYDATYIAAAQRAKSVLATEDKKLFKIASNYVKTMQVAELEKEFDR
jgi:predicted nucleic acid-binding protein